MSENDLVPISMPDYVGDENAFLSGDPESDRLEVKYFLRREDNAVVARTWFGGQPEGPPKCAHGGSIASVLDESMGAVCKVTGHTVLGARLNVRFRRPVPLGTRVNVVAKIAGLRGRTVNARAWMKDAETGFLYAEAAGVYVEINSRRSGR